MKHLFTWIGLLLLESIYAQPLIRLEEYGSGLIGRISDIASAGDGRLFVTEQVGYIWIINPGGGTKSRPFLNIQNKVTTSNPNDVGEQGLLGLAFSPNYATDGFFYVNYTNKTGVGNTVIARYRVSQDPDSADVASEEILLTLRQPYTNHNGGCLKFGADGFLYCALGDGGLGGDPQNRAQNLDSLLGKILRIDVSGGGGYSVPASNPFYNNPNARPEIWAYGLRNPWRFSFDRLTHDLWMADVGQDNYEEVNFQPGSSDGGENYGWRCYEGNHTYNTSGCGTASSYVSPVHEYSQSATEGCSVTGGFVYRGVGQPALTGYYFFADYCNGVIYALTTDGNFTPSVAGSFANVQFSTFGEDTAGELYVGDQSSGKVYHIVDDATSVADYGNDAFRSVIYPQPSNGSFTLELDIPYHQRVAISVGDLAGRKIFTLYHAADAGRNVIPVNTDMLTNGIYAVQLQVGSSSITRKAVIRR